MTTSFERFCFLDVYHNSFMLFYILIHRPVESPQIQLLPLQKR
jgi:hypothetical protein